MAVPKSMTMSSLKGTFVLNKSLSDPVGPILAIEGIPYLARKITDSAKIQQDLEVKDTGSGGDGSRTFSMTATLLSLGPIGLGPLRALGLSPVRKEEHVLGKEYTHDEPIVGSVRGTWWIAGVDEVRADPLLREAEFMTQGAWDAAGCAEVVRMSTRSTKEGVVGEPWQAENIWGFETVDGAGTGEAGVRCVSRMWISKWNGTEKVKAKAKVVYDFVQ